MEAIRRYRYVGEPMLTRGEHGERIEYGYVLDDGWGGIYVWDSFSGYIWVCPEHEAEEFGFVLDEAEESGAL